MDNKDKNIPTKEERENMSPNNRELFLKKRGACGILEAIKLIVQQYNFSLQEVLLALEAKENQDEGFFTDKSDELLNLSNINIVILKDFSSCMKCTTIELIQLLKDLHKDDNETI